MAAYRDGGDIVVTTSGSTGAGRRVLRTATSWVDSFEPAAALCGLDATSTAWIPGPLAASMNLYAAALAAHVAASRVGGPEAASHGFITATVLRDLLAGSGPAPPPGARLIVAGESLPPALADRAADRGWITHHYYGAAQLSFVAWGRDSASLRPFPQVQVHDQDEVLWVRSPWVCTREVITDGRESALLRRIDPQTHAVWSSVGDRGSVTGDGRVVVLGRDDVVLTGGATVRVGDVEAVLAGVASGTVHVIALPHDRLGSVVAAVCTDKSDAARLPAVARGLLTGAALPRRWLFHPSPPTTAAGKLDRQALIAWARPR